jgi:hypothetical protein
MNIIQKRDGPWTFRNETERPDFKIFIFRPHRCQNETRFNNVFSQCYASIITQVRECVQNSHPNDALEWRALQSIVVPFLCPSYLHRTYTCLWERLLGAGRRIQSIRDITSLQIGMGLIISGKNFSGDNIWNVEKYWILMYRRPRLLINSCFSPIVLHLDLPYSLQIQSRKNWETILYET